MKHLGGLIVCVLSLSLLTSGVDQVTGQTNRAS
jgi:hypothetical protein